MYLRAGLVFLVLCVAGCGEEGAPQTTSVPEDLGALDGSWSRLVTDECTVSLRLDSEGGLYAAHRICGLAENAIGDEVEDGQLDLSVAGHVTFRPSRTSCPSGEHGGFTAWYALTDRRLALHTPTGLVTFQLLESGGAPYQGSIRYGCWNKGDFTEHPLADL
jgi:hypothetical protein